MLRQDSVSDDQTELLGDERAVVTASTDYARSLEIPQTLPMRLHTLDFSRHTVIAPDGKRYVVATYNDTHLKRGYITAVYPQQNGYLTLIRLTLYEHSSRTPEEAMQHHIAVAQAIQQGKLNELHR